MSLQELDTFINNAATNPQVQQDIIQKNYTAAFQAAGLPPPTQAQIDALNAIAPDFSVLQQFADSFGVSVVAN